MSNKYQRPNSEYVGDNTLSNRTKYQNDASAEPKVAISSTKMDGDFNYIVDVINGIDEASGSRASINDRLGVSINDDGTLRSSVTASVDEWVNLEAASIVRLDGNSIQIAGNVVSLLDNGRRLKLTIGAQVIYATSAKATLVGEDTQVICTDVVDYYGIETTVTDHPSAVSYSSFTGGLTGSMPLQHSVIKVRADEPLFRLTSEADGEFALKVSSNKLAFVENTGTEIAPSWQVRGEVSSNGIELSDSSLSIAKIAAGNAGEVISWNASGTASSVTAGEEGSVLTSNGNSAAPSFQSVMPSGVITPFAGSTTPIGWVLCDGSAINRTENASLFAAIGTVYGSGDGSTTFNLPDLRGRTVFGVDNMGGTAVNRVTSAGAGVDGTALGANGGSEYVQQHTHTATVNDSGHTHQMAYASDGASGFAASGGGNNFSNATDVNTTSSTTGITVSNANYGQGDSQNIPPAMVLNYIIKT